MRGDLLAHRNIVLTANDHEAAPAEELLDTPHLADALESDRFKQFLDHVPFGIAVSELHPQERLSYANLEFERLIGTSGGQLEGKPWAVLPPNAVARDDGELLSQAVALRDDYIGTFVIKRDEGEITVDAWSNIIEDDDGKPTFRLVALAETANRTPEHAADLKAQIQEKDTLLRELQHRVKNNLQMITALIRLEARNMPDDTSSQAFQRLAGRISSLALLYQSLSEDGQSESVDLGVYLSQVASAVMAAHAIEGIRLNLQVDTWPVSVNVAMPTGLVVNELMINALKYAFVGREGGTITLQSLVNETGCRVTVSDDGIGLAEGTNWPKPGKLSALIVHSLGQNAKARVTIDSTPGAGHTVSIFFARANAEPEPEPEAT
ncbi:MAG: PAS domain-containing protein [Alphaproteobacteria bacterium]|nr:PAS domain-containing protein [Alphaproteobacteria bacterium]MBU1561466.1 PAS domain-containing protein [Alphaproteobacteria bacterium]MBU2301178.1 PAS domain-containing protein [Alphaproteobacteria bacterium]MBU2368986.1 PAS domain-containing protein [Alphaproteobacteria bacterium]